MTLSFLRTRLAAAAVLAATALPIPALAADVELLPPGLLAPTSKEQTKPAAPRTTNINMVEV